MNAKQISKELKSIIKEKHKECTTEQQKNKAVNEARSEINKKYGDVLIFPEKKYGSRFRLF